MIYGGWGVALLSTGHAQTMHVMPGLFLKAGVLVASVLTVVVGLVCWCARCAPVMRIYHVDAHLDARLDAHLVCSP